MGKIFTFRLQVYSEDTDMFGIVHHANYIKFMERARLAWLLHLGIRLDTLMASGIIFVIKKVEVEYFAPASVYDELEIVSQVVKTRRVAKTYHQTIRAQNNPDKIFCSGYIHVVCVNDKFRPQAIPQYLLENM